MRLALLTAALLAGCAPGSPAPAGPATADTAVATGPDAAGPDADFPDSTSRLLRTVGPYEVRRVGPIDPGDWRLVVERGGRRVWDELGHHVGLGQPDDVGRFSAFAGRGAPPSDTAAVRDLNGDGTPELVTWRSSVDGGMCCRIVEALTLGPGAARSVFQMNIGKDESSGFRDLDRDGVDEFLSSDDTFGYWNASGGGSPYPDVVHAWDGARWVFSERHLRRPVPSPDSLSRSAAAVLDATRAGATYPPAALWAQALDLIYAGHWDTADRFLADAWPGDRLGPEAPSREAFAAEFAEQLQRSKFYTSLVALNGRPPP